MQHLTAYVEVDIWCVDDSANKAHPFRHEILAAVGDKNSIYIELQFWFALGLEQIKRCGRWNKQEVGKFNRSLGPIVQGGKRGIVGCGDFMVKAQIVFFGYVFGCPRPQGDG